MLITSRNLMGRATITRKMLSRTNFISLKMVIARYEKMIGKSKEKE